MVDPVYPDLGDECLRKYQCANSKIVNGLSYQSRTKILNPNFGYIDSIDHYTSTCRVDLKHLLFSKFYDATTVKRTKRNKLMARVDFPLPFTLCQPIEAKNVVNEGTHQFFPKDPLAP